MKSVRCCRRAGGAPANEPAPSHPQLAPIPANEKLCGQLDGM
jgi:hypothetical protein